MKLSLTLRALQNQLMQSSELLNVSCKVCISVAGVPLSVWHICGMALALRAALVAVVYLPQAVTRGDVSTSQPRLRDGRWREVRCVL